MLKRLITLFELTLAAQPKVQIEPAQPEVQKKRGRPKK